MKGAAWFVHRKLENYEEDDPHKVRVTGMLYECKNFKHKLPSWNKDVKDRAMLTDLTVT
jgi:hypothetical protein